MKTLLLSALLLAPVCVYAQSVGIGTTAPDASAALDVVSSNKGALLPRVVDVTAIAGPSVGLIAYQTGGTAGYYYYDGTSWQQLVTAGGGGTGFIRNQTTPQTGANLNIDGSGTVGGTLTAANAVVMTALTGNGASLPSGVVGVGVRADGGLNLGQNTVGNNVLLGYQAGQATTGSNNVFSGYLSGSNNTTGYNNVFSGARSGSNNTTGNNNVFSGMSSGYNNTMGNYNVFVGLASGYFNTTGNNNTFNGTYSGYANTSGYNNVFSGFQSGYRNTTGSSNVFSGYLSGYANTTGNSNVFVGLSSGQANTTGNGNLFVGLASGVANTTGNYNSFSGIFSGYANTSGYNNTFSGPRSGYANTTGYNNTFAGYQSGQYNTTGDSNTALGYQSGPANGSGALTNTLALGNGATVSASNSIQLGDANITTLYCKVNLTTTSDARFKYDVQADVPGLAFITRLRPVTYRFDNERLGTFERTGTLPTRSAPDQAADVHTGFLAQDVQATAQELGFRFDGVHVPANARDHYGLGYAQFVVPLVRAVQEQQQQIEALQAQNAALQARAATAEAAAAQATTTLESFEARLRRLEAGTAQAQR